MAGFDTYAKPLKLLEVTLLVITSFSITYDVGWHILDEITAIVVGTLLGTLVAVLFLYISDGPLVKFQCVFQIAMFIYMLVCCAYTLSRDHIILVLYGRDAIDSIKAGCAFGILASLVFLIDGANNFMIQKPFG